LTTTISEVGFSLPYRERAAVAMIKEAQTERIRNLTVGSTQKKSIDKWNDSKPNRNAEDKFHSVRSGDTIRKIANRFPSNVAKLRSMHIAKRVFDHKAASHLIECETVIAFPGACKVTFQRLPESATRVFHSVDAHPLEHNRALLQHFSKSRARAELYPPWLVRTIEEELDRANIVLVPSELVARQMINNQVDPDKIVVKPYGVDMDLFDIEVQPTGQIRRRPKILYVGQISLRKGLYDLIESARGSAVDVILVGNLFDKQIIRDAPSNVIYRPATDHAGLAKLYNSVDAFVLPTLEDACSLVALEAAAVGLPVITTANNGACEILPTKSTTIIEPGNRQELRTSIESVQLLEIEERLHFRSLVVQSASINSWAEYARGVLEAIAK
jgi:glycosyltransferase involved in cell wall biosynthesis